MVMHFNSNALFFLLWHGLRLIVRLGSIVIDISMRIEEVRIHHAARLEPSFMVPQMSAMKMMMSCNAYSICRPHTR